MNKFAKLAGMIESNKFSSLTKDELSFLTGGANTAGVAGGSQTSNTGGDTATCCDKTCVCSCNAAVGFVNPNFNY